MSRFRIICFIIITISSLIIASDTIYVSTQGHVSAEQQLSSNSTPLNKSIYYTLILEWSGNLDKFQINDIPTPELTNFKIIGTKTANEVSSKNDKIISKKIYRYTLKPESIGMGYVDENNISYIEIMSKKLFKIRTDRLQVEIVKPVVKKDYSKIYKEIGIIFGIVIILIVLGMLIKNKVGKKHEQDIEEIVDYETKYIEKLNDLEELKNNKNASGYFTNAYQILKQYLNDKFEMDAMAKSTDDFVSLLVQNDNLDEKTVNKIDSIFRKCDDIKYQGMTPDLPVYNEIFSSIKNLISGLKDIQNILDTET